MRQFAVLALSAIGIVTLFLFFTVPSTSTGSPSDADGDGCLDKVEVQMALGSEAFGGLRDPANPWDFYDVNGDREIDLFNDIFGVAFLFGLNAGDTGYIVAFDRGAPVGPNVWNLTPPDGTIDLFNDIFGVAFQFGHSCALPPPPVVVEWNCTAHPEANPPPGYTCESFAAEAKDIMEWFQSQEGGGAAATGCVKMPDDELGEGGWLSLDGSNCFEEMGQ